MHKRTLVIVGGLLSGLLLTGYQVRVGAQAAPPPSPTPPAAKKKRRVSVVSKTFTEKPTPQGLIRTLIGGVVITSGDTRLTTDKAILNDDTDVASSPGKITLNDEFNTLTATTGVAYLATRDARFRGNVVIVARPRPQDKNAPKGSARRQFDAPATITSDRVDYNWRTRIAQIPGGVTLKQKDRTVVADRATYDSRLERVILEGNVKYTKPNGDIGRAPRVVAIIKEGAEEFRATGGVSAEIEVNEEDETAAPTTPSATSEEPAEPPTEAPAPAPSPQGSGGASR